MPQPLSRLAPRAGYEIGNVGCRTLAQRPQLAILAMEAIAAWSHVENFMLRMYVQMAGGQQADAAAVYLALESNSVKTKAINVLAERKLEPGNLRLLRALIKVAKSAQKERDKLAHWIWGSTPELPDALLLSDPRNQNHAAEEILVYRAEDFEQMRVKFERIAEWSHLFYFILMNHVANRGGRLYEKLCREPEIAEILDRQAQQE